MSKKKINLKEWRKDFYEKCCLGVPVGFVGDEAELSLEDIEDFIPLTTSDR